MKKDAKGAVIDQLVEKLSQSSYFYVTDSSTLPVADINDFRRICFEKGIEIQVTKNALVRKALDRIDGIEYDPKLLEALKGPTTLIFSEVGNLPAKVIKEYREKQNKAKPLIKAAYIDGAIYLGDESLDALATLKSKTELIGEIIGLLQSPAKNVVSALQSGGNKLAGIIKTLSEREG